MKTKVLVTMLFLATMAWGQYTVARTDTNVTQMPNPLPTWGATGVGQKYCSHQFNNLCVIRLTDKNTFPAGGTAQTVEDGKESIISLDEQYFIVRATNGSFRIVTFNHSTGVVKNVGGVISENVFSKVTDNVMFGLKGTIVTKSVTTDGWNTFKTTNVYDFKNCLSTGFKRTWSGSWAVAIDDTTFFSTLSDRGPQGSGEYAVAYRIGSGCSVLDTLTGDVYGWGGKYLGKVDDGVNPLVDRFTIHDGSLAQNSNFASIGSSNVDPAGGSGCKAGNCNDDTPYFWEVGTTHLRPCGVYNCSGHGAEGYWTFAAGKNMRTHYLSDPSKPLTNRTNIPNAAGEIAGSYNNAVKTPGPTDTAPPFGVTMVITNTPVSVFTSPYENEIWAAAGANTYRFTQTLNSGLSKYYVCTNAHTAVAQSGDGFVFTSDMNGGNKVGTCALGKESDGKTCRCDVFWGEAK